MTVEFTDEQKRVIEHVSGHALVASVAGSGKSTVLQYRIHRLVNQEGHRSEEILPLMFNRHARDQFEEGLRSVFQNGKPPRVWTFHAWGQSLLRQFSNDHGKPIPRVEEAPEYWIRMLQEVGEAENDERALRNEEPLVIPRDRADEILGGISLLKNMGYPYFHVPKSLAQDDTMALALLLFDPFELRRHADNTVSLDDLLYDAFAAAWKYRDWWDRHCDAMGYRQIIVDEYQDSNAIQQWLLKSMLRPHISIMAVGDDDQAIYGWRGADPMYMLYRFADDFPGTVRYDLTRTFRYGHAVSLMANNLLKENRDRLVKTCNSPPGMETKVRVLHGTRVDAMIQDALDEIPHSGWKNTAILVRNYRFLDGLELELHRLEMPLAMDKERMFISRPPGKMALNLLEIAMGSSTMSMDAFLEWIRFVYPKAHGDWSRAVAREVEADGWSLGLERSFRKAGTNIKWSTALIDAHRTLVSIAELGPDTPVETFFQTWWSVRKPEKEGEPISLPHYCWILASCLAGKTIADAHAWLAGLAPQEGGLQLMSIHKAKGGGWDHVILPGLAQGTFPASAADEEERRLFYVGITRAKKSLFLLAPEDDHFETRERDWRIDDHWRDRLEDKKFPLRTSQFLYECMPAIAVESQRRWRHQQPLDPSWMEANEYARRVFPDTHDPLGGLLQQLISSSKGNP